MVTVQQEITYRAWVVPEYIVRDMPPAKRQDGMIPLPKERIEAVPQNVLDAMVEQLIGDIYEAADKSSPFSRYD